MLHTCLMTQGAPAISIPGYNEVVFSDDWRAAILQIAPAPLEDEHEPVLIARHAVAQCVAGDLDIEDLPAVVREPKLRHAVNAVLGQIVEIKNLPKGWEDRHLDVQVALRPEMAEAVNESNRRRYYGNPIAGAKELLLKIAVTEVASEPWSDRAKCKGMDPAIFHPDIPEDTPKHEVPRFTEAAREICSSCEVTEQCKQFAWQYTRGSESIRVYGGQAMTPQSKPPRSKREQ